MSDTNMNTVEILQGIKDWTSRNLSKKSNIDGFYETMGVGTAMNLVGKTENTNNSMYRKTGGAEEATDGTAILKNINGNTVAWNQVLKNSDFSTGASNWSVSTNSSFTVSSGEATVEKGVLWQAVAVPLHKYFVMARVKPNTVVDTPRLRITYRTSAGAGLSNTYIDTIANQWNDVLIIKEAENNAAQLSVGYYDGINNGETWNTTNICAIDLTLIYGAGNEPTSVEQFESDYMKWFGKPLTYEEYDEGSLRSVQLDAIKTIGFNQWDEEWEVGGMLANTINSKNIFSVIHGMSYYIRSSTNNANVYARFFDSSKNALPSYTSASGTYLCALNSSFTVPADANYMKFRIGAQYGTTYNHDVCINISDTNKNGTYEPYEEHIASVPTTTLTGKLNGEGESVVVFPDGMKSAGTVYDEIVKRGSQTVAIKRVGSVDLGTLEWFYLSSYGFYSGGINDKVNSGDNYVAYNLICSNFIAMARMSLTTSNNGIAITDSRAISASSTMTSSSDFKASMNGVMLYYELAEPEEYILDDFELPKPYVVNGDGTEEQVQKQGVQGVASTLTCSYGMDAVKTLMNLPQRFVSAAEEQNFSESQKVLARRNIGVEEILAHKANQEGVYEGLTVGLADNLRGDNVVGAEFYRRKSGGTQSVTSGIAAIKEVKGKSIVWNQLQGTFYTLNKKEEGATFNISEDHTQIVAVVGDGGVTEDSYAYISSRLNLTVGHKYIFRGCPKGGANNTYFAVNAIYAGHGIDYGSGALFQADESYSAFGFDAVIRANTPVGTYIFTPQLFDLTLMFGAGNEPATVEEFEKMFPLGYYDYNEGEVIPFAGENLVTTGFNQWDEEWELGIYDYRTGVPTSSSEAIRSKNFNPCLPNASYYFKVPGSESLRILWYDDNKNYIYSQINGNLNNSVQTSPSNAYYFKIGISHAYGTTYKNDICINISNPDKNGTYEPYEKHTLPLDPSQWRDKNGDLVFPYGGMHGVGTSFDYAKVDADGYIRKAVRRFEQVDLGTLAWTKHNSENGRFDGPGLSGVKRSTNSNVVPNIICAKYITNKWFIHPDCDKSVLLDDYLIRVKDSDYNNADATTFKTAMSGVYLYYELAEPVEVELATPVYANYYVNGGGTEAIEPDNGAAPYTTPANLSILYAMDARGEINNLPKNYLSKESAENMLGAMQTAGIIAGYTMTFDAATNRYVFTITAPAASNE